MAAPAASHPQLDGDPFEALSDPNRRAVLELVASGSRSVQAIADELPISRPAVSRHLRILRDAGCVTVRAEGARHYYELSTEGPEVVRSFLAEMWGSGLARFAILAENT